MAFNYLPVEEPDAREVVKLITQAERKAVPIPGDLREEQFCEKFIADAVSELGGLDILVSNAAFQHGAESIAHISTEMFDRTFKTNVYAMFWLVKGALKHMRPGSSIVCTTSVQAY